MEEASSKSTPANKARPKEKQPLDIADRMIAFQRRNASATASRPRAERPTAAKPAATPAPTSPPLPTRSAAPRSPRHPPHDSSRDASLKAPRNTTGGKLFNPDSDPIPTMRRQVAEPEIISEGGSSAYATRGSPAASKLFDYRRDDPMRFNAPALMPRPPPSHKSSADYVSASSTSMSSYASSSFTLTSNTTSSSSSSPPEHGHRKDDTNSAYAVQLKKVYRDISALESRVLAEDPNKESEPSRTLLHGRAPPPQQEQSKWLKLIEDHKNLAELMQALLDITSSPLAPASVHNIPAKYNIPTRLWSHAFHRLLESLRRASPHSVVALEHLTDFIYYAYGFYTSLFEQRSLDVYRSMWIEALGDLARYRMAVAAHLANSPSHAPSSLSQATLPPPAPRIDDSPAPSVGPTALQSLELEPKRETWRTTARTWYAMGLKETPGTGKLHHHLGLLTREGEGEELRGIYHFMKSLTTSHPFVTSRESILQLFSTNAQIRRAQPDARTSDLFVLLHGMLFTHIQLDDFQPTLARFMERLELEGAEEREWIMMGVVNVCSILEYGKPNGLVRMAAGSKDKENESMKKKELVKRVDQMNINADDDDKGFRMDVDEPEQKPINEPEPDVPVTFTFALQLSFAMLSFALRNPIRKANHFSKPTLNPYITVLLTFLTTMLRHPVVVNLVERTMPWEDLASFLNTVPHMFASEVENASRLTSGCAPLSEDWCLRGMEWVGRRIYQHGFWKAGGGDAGEMDVLLAPDNVELTDGVIEDDAADDRIADLGETGKRWIRIVRASAGLTRCVGGFEHNKNTRTWALGDQLKAKVAQWREEDRIEREEEERRRNRRRWDDDEMDVDEEEAGDGLEISSDDEDDTEEVRALKERRRYLRSLLESSRRGGSPTSPRRSRPRLGQSAPTRRPQLNVLPGYTVLVVDTNILLSSLSMFASLVESLKWTIVVPLAVITELDGIASSPTPLGTAAVEATKYLTSHLRTHSASLKVQTSKGNYLRTLSIRSEQVNLSDEGSWERSMDDLILRAAIWQDEHWVDRSALLGVNAAPSQGVAKVVLLSFDRNLRLKARSRQLDAADEHDLASVLAAGR